MVEVARLRRAAFARAASWDQISDSVPA